MKIIVNKKEIAILKDKLILKLNDISEEITYLEKIKEKLVWQGKAHDSLINKYDESIVNIKKRMEVLSLYIKFLDKVNKNYSNALEEIKGEFKMIKGDNYE